MPGMRDEPGRITGNCALLAGYVSAGLSSDFYRAVNYDTATARLFVESSAGNIFSIEIRQIAGKE